MECSSLGLFSPVLRVSEIHLDEMLEELGLLRARKITPGQFFLQVCDGKLTDDDFNDEGNAFAAAYFDFDDGQYLNDYETSLADDLQSLYHVPDTWSTFDAMQPIVDRRFAEWKANGGHINGS